MGTCSECVAPFKKGVKERSDGILDLAIEAPCDFLLNLNLTFATSPSWCNPLLILLMPIITAMAMITMMTTLLVLILFVAPQGCLILLFVAHQGCIVLIVFNILLHLRATCRCSWPPPPVPHPRQTSPGWEFPRSFLSSCDGRSVSSSCCFL